MELELSITGFFSTYPKKKKFFFMANPALPWSQFNASRMVLLQTSFILQKTC